MWLSYEIDTFFPEICHLAMSMGMTEHFYLLMIIFYAISIKTLLIFVVHLTRATAAATKTDLSL